jgi:predicted transcriptional regulator
MPDVYLDLTKEVPISADDDPEILAAIERAREDVRLGRVYTRQQVEEFIIKWRTESAAKKRT